MEQENTMPNELLDPTVILGIENPELVARNRSNRERREARAKKFEQLNDQSHIVQIATAKVMKSLLLVQSALSQAARDDRFRNMSDYQDEALELAPADGELVFNGFKQFSPIFKAQKKRSLKGRVKVGDNEQTLREQILELISKPDRAGETASELWPHFISLLGENGCYPKDFTDAKGRLAIEYDFPRSKKKRNSDGEPIRTMTIGRFRNLVSRLRKSR
jgi:transcriptional regulator of nitric oxide reductase